jgi:hypothetical protein
MRWIKPFFLICFFTLFSTLPVHSQDVVGDLLGRVNNLRASLGLNPYTFNTQLATAANSHASWMATTGEVSHTQYDGSTPRDRASAAGYSSQWVSENIYMGGLANTDSAWNFWINSPIHYAGLTNVHYNDIGIGTAQGTSGQAFVLVFGNSTGAWQNLSPQVSAPSTDNSSGSGSGGSAPVVAAPPVPVVGLDASGNIMYEIQQGDNLGEIVLLFGYDWDMIPYIMEINGLTEEDIRRLKPGNVLLVPSANGTYTPTPIPTIDPAIPTETATPTPEPPTQTPLPSATFTELPPAVYVRPSETPTQALLIRTLPPATNVAMVSTPILQVATIAETPPNTPPLWLIGAIVVQLGVIGFAAVQFFRKR